MTLDPGKIGKKLVVVGDKQITTGEKLGGSAKELREVAAALNGKQRVDKSLGAIEEGTLSTRELLKPISKTLHSIATSLKGVTIPSIDVDTKSIDFPVVGKVKFVTGVSVSSLHPLRTIGSSVESVADNIDNIEKGLKKIADAVGDLQKALPNIRSRILKGADDMEQGGQSLVEAGTATKEAGTLLAS
jgi:hypothetical protein